MSKVWESSELISAFQTREPRELHGSKFAGSSHFSCWQVSTGKTKWPWEEARRESRSAYVIKLRCTLPYRYSCPGGGGGEVKRVFLEGLGGGLSSLYHPGKPPSETQPPPRRHDLGGLGFLFFGLIVAMSTLPGDRALPTASSGQ